MESNDRLKEIARDLRVVLGAMRSRMAGLSNEAVLALMADFEAVGRLASAGQVRTSGEVGMRSRPELGDEGLSRLQNFTSPVKLISNITGASMRECKARLELGRKLRGSVLLGGGEGPAPYPLVTQAIDEGVLGTEAASAIVRQCNELSDRGCSTDLVASAGQTLVDQTISCRLTADQTSQAAIHLREVLDPDGAEPRDEVLQMQRFLTIAQAPDGMMRGKFALTPEQGGVWLASIQAMLSPRVTGTWFLDEDERVAQIVAADTRTQAQKNADTITELIARATRADDMPRINGATATLNVHISVEDLEAGHGVGWIDGVDEPVSA
jgi:hypothetical protein